MKRYQKYKPTGIDWIGEIPSHWDLKKLKYLAKILNGQDHKDVWDENGRYPIVGTGGEFGRANQYLYNQPSVLLGRKGTIDKPQYWDVPFWTVDTAYYTEIPAHTNPKFFFYCCNTILFDLYKYGSAVPSMTQETLNQIQFATPTKEEQTAIANFLDEKTAAIDKLISNKQTLIELLKEERTAIINESVSGEGKNWKREKLKYIVSEKLKYGANEPAEFEELNDPRYIRITDFGDDGKLRNDTFKSLPFESANEYLLKEGDILFARSGATVGKTFHFKNFKGVACFAGYLIKATPDERKVLPDFLYLFTKSGGYENWKNSVFNQATIQNIGADKYSSLEVPVPPIGEQQQIILRIQTETQRIDNTVSKIEKEIELMNEYRTALISEVVTGKIKVV